MIQMLVRLKLLQLGNICSRQSKFSHMRGFVFLLLLTVSAFLLRAELPRENLRVTLCNEIDSPVASLPSKMQHAYHKLLAFPKPLQDSLKGSPHDNFLPMALSSDGLLQYSPWNGNSLGKIRE